MGKQLAITDNGVFVTGSKAFLTVDGVHRKALKMFRTTDGVHRLCFSGGVDVTAMAISYTGNMTDEIVTMADGEYRLLTLTSSGTLTIDQEANAELWMCDGGNGGEGAWNVYSGRGGGGGYIYSTSLILPRNAVAVVGSGGQKNSFGGTTSFDNIVIQPAISSGRYCWDGASGGGGYENGVGGRGTGETTYPFGDTTYFNGKPHSAGGGGGSYDYTFSDGDVREYDGGNGGSNGSDGVKSKNNRPEGGTGGVYGGGDGGYNGGGTADGRYATFYGSGGGGGCYSETEGVGQLAGDGGSGYQGVIYVRIPLNQ